MAHEPIHDAVRHELSGSAEPVLQALLEAFSLHRLSPRSGSRAMLTIARRSLWSVIHAVW
jgi:hypothetical protein